MISQKASTCVTSHMRDESVRWGRVVKEDNIKME
jgi:hypothetical protein